MKNCNNIVTFLQLGKMLILKMLLIDMIGMIHVQEWAINFDPLWFEKMNFDPL